MDHTGACCLLSSRFAPFAVVLNKTMDPAGRVFRARPDLAGQTFNMRAFAPVPISRDKRLRCAPSRRRTTLLEARLHARPASGTNLFRCAPSPVPQSGTDLFRYTPSRVGRGPGLPAKNPLQFSVTRHTLVGDRLWCRAGAGQPLEDTGRHQP